MFRKPATDWLQLSGVSDTGIVMTAAVLLFMLPSGDPHNPRLLTWEDLRRLPWGVLILFGGGLSLAGVVSGSGLALWLGEQLAPLNAMGTTVLVVASVAMVIFLTELTSNLATTATLLPVMGAIAVQARCATDPSYRPDHDRRELRIHAARSDTAECDRLRNGRDQHSANGTRRRFFSTSLV